jgi:hypothetical protein
MIHRRLRFVLFVIPCVAVAVLSIAADRSHPGVIDPTCTSSSPCVEYDNNGSGPGIRGISVGGNGLAGATKFISTSLTNSREGVIGNDISTSGTFNAGVRGISVRGIGVAGQSTNNTGVQGNSSSGNGGAFSSTSGPGLFIASNSNTGAFAESGSDVGVLGETFNGSTSLGKAGVEGLDFGTTTLNFGILGLSADGIAVKGDATSGSGTAIRGIAAAGNGLLVSNSGTSSDAADIFTGGIGGETEVGANNGLALLALGFANSSSIVPAFQAYCLAGAPAMAARSGVLAADIMSLDCSGNMILRGTLTQNGTPLVVKRTTLGTQVATFSAGQTVPTVEDVGEARLVGGQAYVRIAPDFAAIVDRQANYLVFITPQDDTQGWLYVTQKSSTGFLVREHGGGHSTVAFDYRIVAKPYGELAPRLPAMRVDMRTDPSIVAAIQRAVNAKAHVSADIARAREQALRQAAQAQQMQLKAKTLNLRDPG